MSAQQYCVVYRPDATLNVVVLGPYRSKARAEKIVKRIEKIEEREEEERGSYFAPLLPEVVPFVNEATVIKNIKSSFR